MSVLLQIIYDSFHVVSEVKILTLFWYCDVGLINYFAGTDSNVMFHLQCLLFDDSFPVL